MSTSPLISLSKVAFDYADPASRFSLRVPSLEIAKGERVALIGGSGCGKTTLALLLAGIHTPASGEILVDDISVVENPAGANVEFIQNGDFESDAVGANAGKWRAVGTHGSHGRTVVVTDPDDPGNKCLRVVATGPTDPQP